MFDSFDSGFIFGLYLWGIFCGFIFYGFVIAGIWLVWKNLIKIITKAIFDL